MKTGDMKAVFDIIDENKDGEINKDEFINYLRKLISDEEEWKVMKLKIRMGPKKKMENIF